MNIAQQYFNWRRNIEAGKFRHTDLARELGVNVRTVERWLAGENPPRGMAATAITGRIRAIERRQSKRTGDKVKMPR